MRGIGATNRTCLGQQQTLCLNSPNQVGAVLQNKRNAVLHQVPHSARCRVVLTRIRVTWAEDDASCASLRERTADYYVILNEQRPEGYKMRQ